MGYFIDVLTNFLDVECGKVPLLYIQGQKVLGLIKNIVICVLEMNEGLAGLERNEGE